MRRWLALALTLAPATALAQTAPMQAPNATAAGSTGIAVRPGVEVFAQYAARFTNTDSGTDAVHDFDVPRTHASLSASYEHVRARVVLEAVRSASEGSLLGVAGDSLILRLREAWGGWQSPRVDVRAGVAPTLVLPEIEPTWGLRAVAPTPLESTRLIAPADLGVTVRVALPGGRGALAVGARGLQRRGLRAARVQPQQERRGHGPRAPAPRGPTIDARVARTGLTGIFCESMDTSRITVSSVSGRSPRMR